MPLPNGYPLLVDPAMRDAGIAVFIGTVATGVVTKVDGLCTCGDFTSGIAAATFPKCKRAIAFPATENTGSATVANMVLCEVRDIDANAGTCNIYSNDKNDGTDQAPADGTFTFALLLSW
jgi:hypothetical protein